MATSNRTPLTQHIEYFVSGLTQAFAWPRTFILLYASSTLRRVAIEAFVLNGIVFLGSVLLLETFYNHPHNHFLGCPYRILGGYPVYFVCIALNGRFNKRIADHTYQIQLNQGTGKSHDTKAAQSAAQTQATSSSPVQNVAYAIYQMLFYGSCAVFITLLQMIPHIGTMISFIVSCWFISYYCFEFKWVNLGLTMDQRMSSLERHWAFFLGFGIPLTTLTFFLSSLRAAAVYAIFFPSFVIMATTAVVQPPLSARPHSIPSGSSVGLKDLELPDRLPIFTGVKKLNELLISLIRNFGGVRGDSLLLDRKKEAFGKLV
ncbi:hypothetical protein K450DRAFT_236161 [Umbelopsis ramanniana AG]|uniref:Uncharacterized protein n=1 Tax=Umbelopsis ramanniana AG TaxID=1314678 RepID=A0AAD5EBW2_UMBRA|nr:uncharacterized protein K450DRAFT_236161 [Umbelopsis ramanniana AG]KAI8580552.1 hypothetical protein K450DRAFT_236161 [Umbelopsis ramanniana AG]